VNSGNVNKENDVVEKMQVQHIPIDKVKPNPWNCNTMDDEMFNRLAEEIEEVGFVDPIQVVPMDDGMFQIIGGEHRWRALRVLQYEEIPCVVLSDDKWKSVDLQKFVTMRLNAIRGKVSPQKFMELYNDLSDRYEEDALQALMGVMDDDAWKGLTKDVRKGLKEAGAPKEVLKKFDEASAQLKTVDDLSTVLNKLFTEFGDTLDYNFMWFSYGSKDHLYVQCSKETWRTIKGVMKEVNERKLDASVVFGAAMKDWKNHVDLTTGVTGDVADLPQAESTQR
jgi:hypothetical protein